MISHRVSRKPRAGLTLVELLVVISIMTLLAVMAIPAVRPLLESRRIREPARQINNYLSAARTRAQLNGRPAGVLLESDQNLPQACTVLRQVEVPPPYAGDQIGAVVRVNDLGLFVDPAVAPAVTAVPPVRVLQIFFRVGDFSNGLVQPGDLVQFNHQGIRYRLVYTQQLQSWAPLPGSPPYPLPVPVSPPVSPPVVPLMPALPGAPQFFNFNVGVDNSTPPDNWVDTHILLAVADFADAPISPWTGQAVPFSIQRRPQPTSAPPLLLPPRVAIDLVYSGTDGFPQQYLGGPVTLMFGPGGAIQTVYSPVTPPEGFRVITPVYLLVGRRDRVTLDILTPGFPSPAEDGLNNIHDLNNLWVVISSQTGLVNTADMASTPPPPAPTDWFQARRFARDFGKTGDR